VVFGLFFSAIGYVFTNVLLEDIFSFYARWLHTLPWWLGKPLGLCSVCFTGQLTFWGMLPFFRFDYQSVIMYFGIISINIILVQLYEKNRL